jgi:hypothetical protein
MPGIIVSRPIFNKLFKLAHDESLSINAFLTKLLENTGPDALAQAAAGRTQLNESTAIEGSSSGEPQFFGSEPSDDVPAPRPAAPVTAPAPAQRYAEVRTIEYQQPRVEQPVASAPEPEPAGRAPGRRIGNTIWDKVVSMEGHRFATSRGKKFSYKVTGEYIVVRESSARIPRSQFDKAQKMWPVAGPSRLVGVYAPSVVWAVMNEASEAEAAIAEAAK